MLKRLKLTNVGPAPSMPLEFGERLNLLTGDNGLGKSFLLDIAWWTLTRKWPAEVNPKLTAGRKALPANGGEASIAFAFTGKSRTEEYTSSFVRRDQAWTGRAGRPANPGLVLYALSEGAFAVWDPARNYWKKQGKIDVQDRPPAYVLSPTQVWDGLPGESTGSLCNGLITDWAGWQKERGDTFGRLCQVLRSLSPSEEELLTPGELTRISLDDLRDMPTLRMPYGQDVPLVHASAGMRRIIALAYLLVWAWEEHQKAARILDQEPTSQVILLIDEAEAHLHPRWQFRVLPALLDVMASLTESPPSAMPRESATPPTVQIVTATHSPMVLASVEPAFDPSRDAWFDLDYADGAGREVVLTRREFEPRGDVTNWLTSEAFDLPSGRNPAYARLLDEAAGLLEKTERRDDEVQAMHHRLTEALSPKDPFLFRWRGICEKKGLLQ
jgi:hypothetical protein